MSRNSSPWLRAFALCAALGLGGAYVWRQQQKATPPKEATAERAVPSSSKYVAVESAGLPPDSAPAMEPEAQERILMPGSKGGIIELKPEEAKERILMPGSKIGIIELKPEESKKRILMPGSKSFIVIPQEPEAVPPPANSNTDEP